MPKEKRWVFIGDTHAEPNGIWTKDRLTKKRPRQWWLNEQFDTALEEIATLTKKYIVTFGGGGDMVDEPGKANRDAIVERMLPLTKKLSKSCLWGVVGTSYHVGQNGDEDRQVYQELGVTEERISYGHRILEGKRRLWWAHHGATLGVDLEMGLTRTAKKIFDECREYGYAKPDALIFHHTHSTHGEPSFYRGIKVGVVPCWQLPNEYSAKRLMWKTPAIGYTIWNPHTNELTWRLFPIPEGLLYG